MRSIPSMRLGVILTILTVIFLIPNSIRSTPPRSIELKIDGTLTVEGDIKPGNTITITFEFELKPKGHQYQKMKYYFETHNGEKIDRIQEDFMNYSSMSYDSAYIFAVGPLEFNSPHAWKGKLKPNEPVRLVTRATIISDSALYIQGMVGTICNECPDFKGGIHVVCTNRQSVASKVLIEQPPPEPSEGWIKTESGDSVYIKATILKDRSFPGQSIKVKKSDKN